MDGNSTTDQNNSKHHNVIFFDKNSSDKMSAISKMTRPPAPWAVPARPYRPGWELSWALGPLRRPEDVAADLKTSFMWLFFAVERHVLEIRGAFSISLWFVGEMADNSPVLCRKKHRMKQLKKVKRARLSVIIGRVSPFQMALVFSVDHLNSLKALLSWLTVQKSSQATASTEEVKAEVGLMGCRPWMKW